MCVSDDANGPTYVGAMHFQDNSDEAVEYTYDENGRLTQDLNKKISLIQYNAVSLPSEVRFDDGSYITYLYDASGRKLRADYHINQMGTLNPIVGPLPMSVGAGTTDEDETSIASIPIIGPNPPIIPIRLTHTFTEYCGNHIFENGLLTMTLIPGGYISYEGGDAETPSFHFYLCDHEGNNRVVTDINGNIEQVNDYTPFGVLMKNDFTATSPQRYKYNGKELDRMHGLDLYDYGARLYDSPLGRWHVMDPLCEKYYRWSPYVYCMNNPVKFVDPDGKEVIDGVGPYNEENKSYKTLVRDLASHDDKNSIMIVAHGIYEGANYAEAMDVQTYNPTTRQWRSNIISNGQELNDFLTRNSSTWQSYQQGQIRANDLHIVLYSCGTRNLAQKISTDDAFRNVTFIAPDKALQVKKDGNIIVADNQRSKEKNTLHHGEWHTLRNGKEPIIFGDYDKYAKPGIKEFKYENTIYLPF